MEAIFTGFRGGERFAKALRRFAKALPQGCKSPFLRSCFPKRSLRLSNEEDFTEKVEGVSNDFTPLQGDWVQISPFGQFPHGRGMQYFAKTDSETLVNNFNSLKARLLRRFGGLPWYEGHPDTSPKDYPNKKAFGWIDNVETRDDGLYGHVKWTKGGQELISDGHYKYFSPVWDAAPAMVNGKAVLRPTELISVGFTNTPNMPVLPLSNEESEAGPATVPNENAMKLPPHLKKFLGFENDAEPDDEAIETAAQKKAEELDNAMKVKTANEEAEAASAALANEKETLTTELENAKAVNKTLAEQLDSTAKTFDVERHERIELIVANGIAAGKITAAEADKWKTDLKEDFAGKSVELANSKPVIKTKGMTDNLGQQQANLEQGATPGEQVKALANEKVEQGMSYDAAWQSVKKERPDLFAGMHQPQVPA